MSSIYCFFPESTLEIYTDKSDKLINDSRYCSCIRVCHKDLGEAYTTILMIVSTVHLHTYVTRFAKRDLIHAQFQDTLHF